MDKSDCILYESGVAIQLENEENSLAEKRNTYYVELLGK